jgi:cleavage and polyadenylation specificity factor subunit 1
VPSDITSDRGAQFTSSLWQGMAEAFGTQIHHTTAYHPQSNGLVERFHRSLKATLRAKLKGPDWCSQLPWTMLGLRTAPKENGVSAADATLRHAPKLPGRFVAPSQDVRLSGQSPVISVSHHGTPSSGVPAAIRTAKHAFLRVDSNRKPLQRPYQGPYQITSRNNKTATLRINGKERTVSLDRLKPAFLPEEEKEPVVSRAGRLSLPPERFQGGK